MACSARCQGNGSGSASSSRSVPVKRHSHPICTAVPRPVCEELLECMVEQLGQQTLLLEQIRQQLADQTGNKE